MEAERTRVDLKEKILMRFQGNWGPLFERYSGLPTRGRGRNIKMICPFHNDQNPSLSINSETSQYNCFGCDAKGDWATFVGRRRNMDPKTEFKEIMAEIVQDFEL